MKAKHIQTIIGVFAGAGIIVMSGKAQEFQNLDFESALGSPINNVVNGFYNLPGWSVNTVGDQSGASSGGVFYNSSILDGTDAYIVPVGGYDVLPGSDGHYGSVPSFGPLDGDQSLALYVSGYNAPASISISQTGTIPNAQSSISFLLGFFNTYDLPFSQNPLSYFSLSINNQNVPLVVTSVNGQVLTVAGNISQWAGQTVALSIADTVAIEQGEAFGVIDDVAFSPVAVPEPTTLAWGGFGGLLSLVAFHRK